MSARCKPEQPQLVPGLTSGGKTDVVLAFEVTDGERVQWLKFDPNPFA
jgi:hypothetical protein